MNINEYLFFLRGLRDLRNHISEMCELQRTMDNEMKLQEFLGIKGQHREMSDLNEKRAAERKASMEYKQSKIETYKNILHTIKEFIGTYNFFTYCTYHIYTYRFLTYIKYLIL